ncbi:MAG TPA: selenocysteine-specific translation elongation factor [Candidatus Baltobacteraceae bacterium]|nr:selenocysteine-specific translation elongation factor [Candidatus Baltobacteraceae bacterium]
MHIVGTAGHVDHGKSALVAALTGTNPDRWVEERERGMTLDLGFAHLRYDDGVEGGIVDVPGHERFLHNMLAGAAGMELLLLIVDAVEGVMPQTLEHLQILQFLNVRRIIVVASKIDLIDEAERDDVAPRIAEHLQGTIAASAPIYPVSVVTGENLDTLRSVLHDELASLPPRNTDAPAYLPVDRVFSLPGLGTVVTGTLMQGRIETGETLMLEPGGKTAHVRSIGVFGSTRPSVEAGARVALNLPGIDRQEIERGHALVGRELSARTNFAVRFVPLQSALSLIGRRTAVRAYVGSSEVLGTLVAQNGSVTANEMRANLHLREPVVAFPGLRFVLRRPSPMTLLGGGRVEALDVSDDADSVGAAERAAAALLHEHGLQPVDLAAVALAVNLRERAAREVLERLVAREEALPIERPAEYVDGAAARVLLARVVEGLHDAQERETWAMGVTSLALSRSLGIGEPLLVRIMERFVSEGRLLHRSGYYCTVDHEPAFTSEQQAFFDHLVPLDEEQPFLPIPFAGAAAAVKLAKLTGAVRAFDTLLARGALVKVGDDLYRGSQIADIRTRVETLLTERERMTAAEFRDLLGTSRKYAVPMLEWLDGHGITIRSGDFRTLRRNAASRS